MFEQLGPEAERSGALLLTAIGYDYVPGNLAAALAMDEAEGEVRSVDVGYFATGTVAEGKLSGGTRASFARASVEPSFAWRGGRIVEEAAAKRVKSFEIGGEERPAVSVASSEHYTLPRLEPGLEQVDAYLGWFGHRSRAMSLFSRATHNLLRIPGLRPAARALVERQSGSSGGPSKAERDRSASDVIATARDSSARALATARVAGSDPYSFTADFIAWAASAAAASRPEGAGAVGPVEAFGLAELERGCAAAGIKRVDA